MPSLSSKHYKRMIDTCRMFGATRKSENHNPSTYVLSVDGRTHPLTCLHVSSRSRLILRPSLSNSLILVVDYEIFLAVPHILGLAALGTVGLINYTL